MNDCCGVKILNLDSLDALTGLEYLLVSSKDGDYKVPVSQLATLFSGGTSANPDQYNTLLALFEAFRSDLSASFKELKDNTTEQLKSLREALNDQISDCRTHCTAKFTELSKQLEELKKAFEKYKQEIKEIIDSIDTGGSSDAGDDLSKLRDQLLAALNQADLMMQSLSSQTNNFRNEFTQVVEDLNSRMETVEGKLNEFIEETRAAIDEINSKLAEIEAKLVVINNRLATIEHRLEEITTELAKLSDRLTKVENGLAELKQSFEAYKAENDAKVNKNIADIAQLRTDVDGLKEAMLDLEDIQTALNKGTGVTLEFEKDKLKLPLWTGTKEQYDAIEPKVQGMTYNIIVEGES